jgi:ketosteroid isomerase-like protein
MNRKFTVSVVASVILLAVLGTFAAAQSVEDQIKKLETERAAAVVKGDVALLTAQTSDDYTLINVNGQVSTKTQMVDGFKSGQNKMTKDEVSDLKVRLYGNTAIVTGTVDAQGTMGGKDASGQALFTRVWVKKGGKWITVSLQQTRVPTM